MQDVRIAGRHLLKKRTDVALKIFQEPGKMHQFVPGTAQDIAYWYLRWIRACGNWFSSVGSCIHHGLSAPCE